MLSYYTYTQKGNFTGETRGYWICELLFGKNLCKKARIKPQLFEIDTARNVEKTFFDIDFSQLFENHNF